MRAVKCPYCDGDAVLVTGEVIYPHRHDLNNLFFWSCDPCNAYVGCHKKGAPIGNTRSDGTVPLGRLANASLRKAKSLAHAAFDPLWKSKNISRRSAYQWLANELAIDINDCHIGMFDLEMCNRVVEVCHAP